MHAPKNLKVRDRNTFPNAMQLFVQALGVADQGGCNYCPSGQHNTGNGATDALIRRGSVGEPSSLNGDQFDLVMG